jgi:predicted small lipoprotein YifL
MLVKTLRNLIVPLGMTIAVSLVVSGCGRKGDIDPPSMPAEQKNKRSPEQKAKAAPERPFLLDPLL